MIERAFRLVPESWRPVHRALARVGGFFWKPCPLCGREFGGHEWRHINGKYSAIPDPEQPDSGGGIAICPNCTRAGRGDPAIPYGQWLLW